MRVMRDGVALGYEPAGTVNPPVVLVHGWGTSREVMRPLAEHLRDRHRVVAVDLRGHGESDARQQSYTIRGFSDDVAHLVAELGLEAPIVIGHSMGGVVTLDYAARHDDTAAAVILESPVAAPDELLAGMVPMLEGMRSPAYRDTVAGMLRVVGGPHIESELRARLVELIASTPQHVLVSAMEDMLAYDSVAAARQVSCPLLYVGTSTPYADLPRLRELCPQLVTGQLVGCGHYFPLEVPEQLNPMVTRFLATC